MGKLTSGIGMEGPMIVCMRIQFVSYCYAYTRRLSPSLHVSVFHSRVHSHFIRAHADVWRERGFSTPTLTQTHTHLTPKGMKSLAVELTNSPPLSNSTHTHAFCFLLQNMKAVEEKGWPWVARAVGV
jgi:hypothetical protein